MSIKELSFEQYRKTVFECINLLEDIKYEPKL